MFSVDKSGPWTLVSWSTLQETPGWGCRAWVDSKHPTTTPLHDERWTDTRFTPAPRTLHIPSTRNVCGRECAGACPPPANGRLKMRERFPCSADTHGGGESSCTMGGGGWPSVQLSTITSPGCTSSFDQDTQLPSLTHSCSKLQD